MKKSIIAAGAVSAVVAAMPIVGVFADPATSTVTDEIVITIAKECAITTNTTEAADGIGNGTHTDRQFTASMQNGERKELGGSTSEGAQDGATSVVNVVCNDAATSGDATSWSLTAVGGIVGTVSTVLDATGSGTDIVTGTAISGATSNWAMKVDVDSSLTVQNGFNVFRAVPSSPTVVTTGNGSKSAAFTPTYQVYIGTSQEADTYTGHVTYTLTNPSS